MDHAPDGRSSGGLATSRGFDIKAETRRSASAASFRPASLGNHVCRARVSAMSATRRRSGAEWFWRRDIMERRIVLAGLAAGAAGALAGRAALAQSSPAPATDAPAAAGSSAPVVPLAPAPAMKMDMPATGMSDAVRAHIKDTMTVGSLSLITSRIAQSKLKHPMGKQFADFEVAEQNTIADILKSRMMQAAKPMGDVKAPTDAEVEGNLDAKGKDMVEKLRAMKEGPEFEKAYIKAQIDGHKQLLDIQDTYLKMADDADETNVAKLAKGMIKEHLVLLGDIEKHLG